MHAIGIDQPTVHRNLRGMLTFCLLFTLCWPSALAAQDGASEFELPQDAFESPRSEPFGGEDMDFDFGMEGFEEFGSDEFTGNQPTESEEAMGTALVAVTMVGIAIMGLLGLALTVLVAYIQFDALRTLPEQYREIPPAIPWLLLIPVVNIVVLFVVFLQVPKSLSRFLSAQGDQSLGDCGGKLGLWGSVLYILACTFPIGLVLLVISMLKINQARNQAKSLVNSGGHTPATAPSR